MAETKNKDVEAKTQKKAPKVNYKGMFELFTVASIIFSTAIIVLGTDSYLVWSMTAPMALWAAQKLVMRFVR